MENLEDNMEENELEQAGLKKEPEKLGRLQFKLDYDFQQNQVYLKRENSCFSWI